jgi:hypothetical protein
MEARVDLLDLAMRYATAALVIVTLAIFTVGFTAGAIIL